MLNEVSAQNRSRYQIKNTLGQGGMGIVYLAKDLRLERLVAVKCLKQEALNNDNKNKHKHLQKEANTLAQLNHPHIVQIYDIIDDEQGFALVMEYIKGNTLNVQLREHITPFKQRLIWLQQIAAGLAAAHEKGLIHRDLKADNILINEQNIAKITDFGIAKNTLNKNGDHTETGHFVGSYNILSPEQALGAAVDHRSDLFSFGILAFKLLCGHHPFGNSDNHNVLVQNILHQPPLSAKQLNVDLADGLVDLLNSLLMKNRQQRPKDANIVSQQLQAYIDNCQDEKTEPTFADTECIPWPQYSSAELSQNDRVAFVDVKQSGEPLITENSSIDSLKKTAVTSHGKKNNKRTTIIINTLLVVFSIVLTSAVYWYNQFSGASENLYVAILPPIINDDSPMSAGQQQLLIETFNTALQEQVIATKGLHLISQQQIANSSGDYAQRAKAIAADVLLESILTCEAQRCQVELSRIEAQQQSRAKQTSTENRWAISHQQSWPIVVDRQYLNINIEAQQRITRLFPDLQSNLTRTLLSEQDYQIFLSYRHKINIKAKYSSITWQQLWQLQSRYQGYLPYYELMGYIGVMLYDDSADSHYLEQLTELLNNGKQRFGTRAELLRKRFQIFLRQQEFVKAEDVIINLEKFKEDKVTLLTLRGILANFQGNYQKADKLFNQALILRPSTSLWYRIANNNYYQGDNYAALAALNELLKLDANDKDAFTLKATIYVFTGQLTAAIELYQRLISDDSNSSLYNNLGMVYELLGNFRQAETFFSKATLLAPNESTLRLNLADSLQLQGKNTEAAKHYQQVITSAQNRVDDWSAQLNIALAQIQLGDTAASFQALHRSIRLAGNNADVIFNAAVIYSLAEQWPVALSYIEQSLQSDISPIWFKLAWFEGLCAKEAQAFNQLLVNSSHNRQSYALPRCTPK